MGLRTNARMQTFFLYLNSDAICDSLCHHSGLALTVQYLAIQG